MTIGRKVKLRERFGTKIQLGQKGPLFKVIAKENKVNKPGAFHRSLRGELRNEKKGLSAHKTKI